MSVPTEEAKITLINPHPVFTCESCVDEVCIEYSKFNLVKKLFVKYSPFVGVQGKSI